MLGLRISGALDHLLGVRQLVFEPCVPTRATKFPAGPEWLHEIKHDGYRLIVPL